MHEDEYIWIFLLQRFIRQLCTLYRNLWMCRCTADCGWITGHSYLTYGPLLNGASIVVFEGVPNYPDAGRCWEIVDKYKVSIFYTAPTAIRSLMQSGNEPVKRHSRKSLRVLGSVGEPINPRAWRWYYDVVGDARCPISDTWWQTETGGFMITPLPGGWPLKPGSATLPFFGVQVHCSCLQLQSILQYSFVPKSMYYNLSVCMLKVQSKCLALS
jgi:acyl-coenzyme A synthetase/AMP-(fatty) acid ligase